MNQLKLGALCGYINMIIGYAISLAYTPYMLRKMGQSEYGLYTLVISTISYLSLLSFGFGASYIRIYSNYKAEKKEEKIPELNGMYLTVFFILGMIALLTGCYLASKVELIFGSKLTENELITSKILMIILSLNIGLTFPRSVFNVYIQVKEKFLYLKLLQMFNLIFTPLMTIAVLVMGYKSKGLASVTLFSQVLTFIFSVIYCKRSLKMKISFKNFELKLMKEILIFSSFIFINMIINQINWNVDKFILGRFWGTSKVAVYGVAAQLNIYFISISTTISSMFVPRVNRLVASGNNDEDLLKLFIKIGRIQFILLTLVLTGIYIFGKAFIEMWAGEDYIKAYYILLILITGGLVPSTQNIGIEIQRAKNKHKFRSVIYLLIAMVNLGVSIPLIKLYGGIGAAIGTAGALIIGNVMIMNIYYHTVIGLNMKKFWKEIFSLLKALILPLLLGAYINLTFDLNNIYNFVLFGLLYVIVFSVSMWFLGMNKDEKKIIGEPLKKLISGFTCLKI